MKYYTVPLNEVLEEMRKLLRHYTTNQRLNLSGVQGLVYLIDWLKSKQ